METLLKDVDYDNIPALLGGGFQLYNEPFTFDGGASKHFFFSFFVRDLTCRYL
jgi:hypothetical protein